jgi:4-amino-4-deoxy-L-arabinose transferase-like glycosyltransferase
VTAVTAGAAARHRLAAAGTARAGRWTRPGLAALLAATALLYLAGLSRNGWANDFYAAAVQAGTRSWKAFFFGSFDSANFITVDKTPASLWAMELSARIVGLSSWSMLVPQALAGVGSVALLYAAVRRWFGPVAGLLAGAALALTPVATLMFRFNNPDALLVLLLTAAGYAMVRAVESGRARWLVLAGTLLGFGFLTKMLQAFLVLPAFGLAYLLAGPTRLRTRIWQLLAGLGAVIAGAGWWVAAVMLTPAADRPYIGGSTSNSILQLALGYNGLGRLDGNETGSVGFAAGRGGGGGPGGGGPAFGGSAGLGRLFGGEMGGQISWLLPAALLASAVLAWLTWRARRRRLGVPAGPAGPDRNLSALLLWGGWLLVTGAVFSFMAGIIHPYYTAALAPPIAALTGIAAVQLWRLRGGWPARALLAAGLGLTAIWSLILLDRTPTWHPPLRFAVLAIGLVSAALLLIPRRAVTGYVRARRGVTLHGLAAAGAIAAMLAGPAAYSLSTAATAHTGALPSAGPTVATSFGGPGGGGPGGGMPGMGGARGAAGSAGQNAPGGAPSGASGSVPGSTGSSGAGPGGFGGTASGAGGTAPGSTGSGSSGSGNAGSGAAGPGGLGGAGAPGGTSSGAGQLPSSPGSAAGRNFAGGQGGGPGGLGGSTEVSGALTRLLTTHASAYTWVAATVGSESAAPLQLAADEPVMSIGGFNGTDPTPTLAQFQRLVAAHKIHYFVGANAHSFGGGSGAASAITRWVAAHFTARTVGGETVYDLTAPRTAT